MSQSKRSTTGNWEDEDDIIPDMSDPYWVERISKATISRGYPK